MPGMVWTATVAVAPSPRLRASGLRTRQLCESEVEHLDAPVCGDEDVLRLQVAMHHAFVVRGRQPLGDLRRVLQIARR